MTPVEKRAAILQIMTQPIEQGPRIEEICEGSPFCRCMVAERAKGGNLRSQYKYGVRNKATRAANAAYMREYNRKKRLNGTA